MKATPMLNIKELKTGDILKVNTHGLALRRGTVLMLQIRGRGHVWCLTTSGETVRLERGYVSLVYRRDKRYTYEPNPYKKRFIVTRGTICNSEFIKRVK